MKTRTLLTALVALTLAGTARAGDTLAQQAHKAGISLALAKKCIAAGMVFDPSDNSFASPNALGVPIPKNPPATHYVYTYGDGAVFRIEDANGEIHFIRGYGYRYDPVNRHTWFLTANAKWIQIK